MTPLQVFGILNKHLILGSNIKDKYEIKYEFYFLATQTRVLSRKGRSKTHLHKVIQEIHLT